MTIDRYEDARERNRIKIQEFRTGTITLTRVTHAARDPATPWQPGASQDPVVYTLDARVDGVAEEYVRDTIEATDRMMIVSPRATYTEGSETLTADIVPQLTDAISIDGVAVVIKKIDAVPAAGAAARFHIFIAS